MVDIAREVCLAGHTYVGCVGDVGHIVGVAAIVAVGFVVSGADHVGLGS